VEASAIGGHSAWNLRLGNRPLRLAAGSHGSPREGVCVVELASLLAGEKFSDRPRCVCDVVAGFMRSLNDRLAHADRQRLIPYASRALGTDDGPGPARARRDLCLAWAGANTEGGALRRLAGRLGLRLKIWALVGIREALRLDEGAAVLAARGRQAFVEYNPLPVAASDPTRIYRVVTSGPLVEVLALDLRSYRGANSENRQPALSDDSRVMGAAQVAWLKSRLAASRATWKVIANDMPIGVVVRDGPNHFEAVANGHDGPPLGRELEIAEILSFIRERRIRNVVWVTGDVHYCAAHHYQPSRARFTGFDPFWEFVAGPLHAGAFAPGGLDATFGPEVTFTGVPADSKPNRPPSSGLQFFGTLAINARTRVLTAALHNLSGRAIYSVELDAQP